MTTQGDPEQGNSPRSGGSASSGGEADRKPAFMYVHYLTESHQEPFPAYLFQLDDTPPDDQIATAVELIRSKKVPEVKAGTLGKVEWRVYSYAVFVLDYEKAEIISVEFTHLENNGPNRTFDNEKHVASNDGSWSAVYYHNKRKNKVNQDLGPTECDLVGWKVEHSRKGVVPPERRFDHQSSDPNTGP